jgi:hypothetical protein
MFKYEPVDLLFGISIESKSKKVGFSADIFTLVGFSFTIGTCTSYNSVFG